MTTTPHLALHTLREGHGLPVLLVHGFPLDHRMWEDAAAALPSGITVLAVDLPGLGESPLGGEPPSIEAAADAVVDAARAAGIERAVVVGMSMGGYVALAAAERHADFVVALGLVDTKSTADDDAARANRLRIADAVSESRTVDAVLGMPGALLGATSKVARRGLTARLEEWIRSQRPDGVAWAQRAMAARPDRTQVLARFAGPVAVVVGEEDTLTPIEAAEHLVAAAPGATLVVVPAAGHMSAVEDAPAVANAIGDLWAVARD
ncbi:alpha/beta fold hydrolase [Oerskovia enterophila]|uniref:alpha/beta fold hydrolase n=1 Tax=Oerskovia enterophila TaxID=43678 RepID=UPI003395A3D4